MASEAAKKLPVVRIDAPGFSLALRFDPSDECDCEILAEAYLLVKRRAGEQSREALEQWRTGR